MACGASVMLVPEPWRQWILLDGPVDAVHQHVLSFAQIRYMLLDLRPGFLHARSGSRT